MTLLQTIKQLPDTPGIYQYFDKDGRLLYVGKAKSLKNRVKSYFSFTPTLRANPKSSQRIVQMIEQVHELNYIVVNSEHDALILENSLIKQLHPKYNILLRDDKTYPYIYIDYTQPYPRPEITRKVIQGKDIHYFGPYSVGARDIVDSLYELCKLVQKKGCLTSKKLCLYHQIDKCLGPCELPITKERYNEELESALTLIKDKKLLIQKLEQKMHLYAEQMRFEEAAELRDRIEKISRSQIHSEIDFASKENYDIFVIEHDGSRCVIVRLFMREGKIISSSHDELHTPHGVDFNELYRTALLEFYTNEKPPIVAPVLLGDDFEDKTLVAEHLSALFGKKATLLVPKRGEKKELISLARLNAQEHLRRKTKSIDTQLLSDTQELFELMRTPYRVEVFDNSHMSGVATVGAMVVWDKGVFEKKSYRTYHLDARDEYAQMKEMLTRRIESFEKNSPPDLWVLDGGETLRSLAEDLLHTAGGNLDVIAIAKEKVDAKAHRAKGKANDIIVTKTQALHLKNSDKRLQWVQKLRDEAHRVAITFHKKTKLKLDQESKLLSLKGISQAKIVKLLNHFGTFEEIKKLSFEQISEVLNKNDANIIKNFYK